jgi:3-dehydroquinate dehydratase type I
MSQNKTIPYCLPIHPKALLRDSVAGTNIPATTMTLEQIEVQVLQNPYLDRYPYVEIWLDYLEDEPATALARLCCHPVLATKGIVFTLRTLDLSEPRHTLKARCETVGLLNKGGRDLAIKPSVSLFLDLDVRTQLPELAAFCETRSTDSPFSLITSFHDFDKTMNAAEFDRVITSMATYNPQIFKVATYCNTPHDATFLLEAGLRLRDEGRRAIILGMGPYGVATRIFGTLWGNTLCYCPVQTDGRSAPGQYSIDHFHRLFELLEN